MSERTADAERDRAERHKALLEDCEPVGMVSEPHICAFSDALSISHRDVLSLVARNQQLQEALARLVTYADNAEQKMRREYRAAGATYADEDWTKNEMESWAEGEALQDVLAEARAAFASVRARTPQ